MRTYRQYREQVALNAVYRSMALALRAINCGPEQAHRVAELLAEQAPAKFSRAVFMEVFHGGQTIADGYLIKDRENLKKAEVDARRRTQVAYLRKNDVKQKSVPQD